LLRENLSEGNSLPTRLIYSISGSHHHFSVRLCYIKWKHFFYVCRRQNIVKHYALCSYRAYVLCVS